MPGATSHLTPRPRTRTGRERLLDLAEHREATPQPRHLGFGQPAGELASTKLQPSKVASLAAWPRSVSVATPCHRRDRLPGDVATEHQGVDELANSRRLIPSPSIFSGIVPSSLTR